MAGDYTGKPCPKCAYVRTAADTATPDWQCPNCDVVYAKFGQAPTASAPAAPRAAPREESADGSPGFAKLAHISSLANALLPPLGTIVPIAIWVMKSGEDEAAVDAAKEALNFQISMLLWALAFLIPIAVFPPFVFITWIALVILGFAYIIMPIVATVRVGEGLRYYYPYTLHIFGEGPGA